MNSKCFYRASLKCVSCDESTTYSGKTKNLRKRINNNISHCRTGNTDDQFDEHVRRCNNDLSEPFFKVYIFLEVLDEKLLDSYENYFHSNNHDIMNRKAR